MKKLVLPIAMIIIGVISVFWYSWPAYQETNEINSDIEEFETALDQVNEIQQIRDNLLGQYNEIPESNLYVVDRILPNELNTVRMLIELDQIAISSGLSVSDISFSNRSDQVTDISQGDQPVGPQTPYESAELSFSVSGSYDDALAFIRNIERSTRLIDILELSISNQSEEEQEGQTVAPSEQTAPLGDNISFSITGKTYWLPNEES